MIQHWKSLDCFRNASFAMMIPAATKDFRSAIIFGVSKYQFYKVLGFGKHNQSFQFHHFSFSGSGSASSEK